MAKKVKIKGLVGKSANTLKKLTDKQVREIYGLTQAEAGALIDVSYRTIRRFENKEKGERKEKVAKLYDRLRQNLSAEIHKQTLKEADRMAESLRLKAKKIQAHTDKHGYNDSAAVKLVQTALGEWDALIAKYGSVDKIPEKYASSYYAKFEKMLEYKTIQSVKAYEQWRKNAEESSSRRSGEKDREDNMTYWDLYSMIMKNPDFIKIIQKKGYKGTVSEQIQHFIIDQRVKGLSFEDILLMLEYEYDMSEQQKAKEKEEEAESYKMFF